MCAHSCAHPIFLSFLVHDRRDGGISRGAFRPCRKRAVPGDARSPDRPSAPAGARRGAGDARRSGFDLPAGTDAATLGGRLREPAAPLHERGEGVVGLRRDRTNRRGSCSSTSSRLSVVRRGCRTGAGCDRGARRRSGCRRSCSRSTGTRRSAQVDQDLWLAVEGRRQRAEPAPRLRRGSLRAGDRRAAARPPPHPAS